MSENGWRTPTDDYLDGIVLGGSYAFLWLACPFSFLYAGFTGRWGWAAVGVVMVLLCSYMINDTTRRIHGDDEDDVHRAGSR